MKARQGNTLLSLRNVQAFLDEYATTLGPVNETGARHKLDAIIVALADHTSAQTGHAIEARGATQKQNALRTQLRRDFMTPIARIARAELSNTPEIGPLRMPKGRPTIERLGAAASGMGIAAQQHVAVFVANGLPADFIDRLDAKAAEMVESLSIRDQCRGKVKGATTGLALLLSTGRKTVHILDAFVRTALNDDPSLLSNWDGVKRQKARRVTAPVATPTPAIPVPVAVPSTA